MLGILSATAEINILSVCSNLNPEARSEMLAMPSSFKISFRVGWARLKLSFYCIPTNGINSTY